MAHLLMPVEEGFDVTTIWSGDAMRYSQPPFAHLDDSYGDAVSKYNPTPGTGKTGYMHVPPNPYPFYNEDERYLPLIQPDGGQMSEWQPAYNPTPEQEAADKQAAYETGIPHGYVPSGNQYAGKPTITLWVTSHLHDSSEYGSTVDESGNHSGGPFQIQVCPDMRVHEVRNIVYKVGGILPGLQRLVYAGKRMEDPQRTLKHYGVAFWHTHFPNWPIVVRRY